jgi:hypothetical protein
MKNVAVAMTRRTGIVSRKRRRMKRSMGGRVGEDA